MPIKRTATKSGARKNLLTDLILAKYRADPEGFRIYLPDVAKVLDSMSKPHRLSRSPFGLTEHERAHRIQALESIVEGLGKGQVDSGGAIRALEHCAVLTEDDSLPREIDYKTLLRLLRFAIGKPISEVKGKATIAIQREQSDKAVNHVSLIRGVILDLSSDMRLVSVTVNPQKVKERRRAVRFIAMTEDVSRSTAEHQHSGLEEEGHATS